MGGQSARTRRPAGQGCKGCRVGGGDVLPGPFFIARHHQVRDGRREIQVVGQVGQCLGRSAAHMAAKRAPVSVFPGVQPGGRGGPG